MEEQKMDRLILGEMENFYGTVENADNVQRFQQLCRHAEAMARQAHGSLQIEAPRRESPNASAELGLHLPLMMLNENFRLHFAQLMQCSDCVGLKEVDGMLRLSCTVTEVWEEA